jgi:oligosaccharide repeat unit polymerase
MFPEYWQMASDLAKGATGGDFLTLIRARSVMQAQEVGSLDAVKNLPVVATLVCYALWIETDGSWSRRIRAWVATFLALVYGVLTGSKGNGVITILGVVFVLAVLGKLKVKAAVISLSLAVALFFAGILYVNFAYAKTDSTPKQRIARFVAKQVELYWLSGPVNFDRVAQNPGEIPHVQDIDHFPKQTLNSLHLGKWEVPSIHAMQVQSSSDPEMPPSNVYSIYFSYYPEFGFPGVVILTGIAGFLSSIVFAYARGGSRSMVAFYGQLAVATILSFNGDHYYMGGNQFAKSLLLYWIIYQSPMIVFAGKKIFKPRPMYPNAPLEAQ